MSDLLIGATDGYAWGINNSGTVIGYSYFDNGPQRAWVWQNGVTTWLPALPSTFIASAAALAINDQGAVAGLSNTASATHAVLWENGLPLDLGTLGGTYSYGLAINNKTQVVGWAETVPGQIADAYVWQNGIMTDLNPAGATGSTAFGINDRSQIVGQLVIDNCASHPFIWEKGKATDLDTVIIDSPPIWGYARAINNSGQIAAVVLQDQLVCGSQVEVAAVLNPLGNEEQAAQ
jgi:probable HAF family extracellular repeat protein